MMMVLAALQPGPMFLSSKVYQLSPAEVRYSRYCFRFIGPVFSGWVFNKNLIAGFCTGKYVDETNTVV